jgi:tRNA dimethylallyltransferase
MGPTAAGKTGLAVELVKRLPCAIISADSAQVFRHMNIGTSKPGPDILAIAPHRLIDILDPAESYSAGRFRADALCEMDAITACGKIPLLVGGTMLYFRALYRGFADLPEANPEIRERIDREARTLGWERLHDRLAAIDPNAAVQIHRNDPQRIQRALEVYEITGQTLTELFASQEDKTFPYEAIRLIVAPARRSTLQEHIAARFRGMLRQGLIEEVRGLQARGDLDLDKPAIRAVGYRQVWEYLDGKVGYMEMIERAIIATRQLAKRQLTWLRAEEHAAWFDSLNPHVLQEVLIHLATHAQGA